jgi:hypothetical protein
MLSPQILLQIYLFLLGNKKSLPHYYKQNTIINQKKLTDEIAIFFD